MTERNRIYEWMHEYIMECLNKEQAVEGSLVEWRQLAFEMGQIRNILWMSHHDGIEPEMALEIDTRLHRMMPPKDSRELDSTVYQLMRCNEELQKAYFERRYEHEVLQKGFPWRDEQADDIDQDDEIPWSDDDEQDDSDQDYFIEQAAREIRTAYEETARQERDSHLRELREGIHRLTDEVNKADVGYGPTEAWHAAVESFYPRCYTYCQGICPLEAAEFLLYVLYEIKQLRITDRETCLQASARIRNLVGRLFDLLYRLASGR